MGFALHVQLDFTAPIPLLLLNSHVSMAHTAQVVAQFAAIVLPAKRAHTQTEHQQFNVPVEPSALGSRCLALRVLLGMHALQPLLIL